MNQNPEKLTLAGIDAWARAVAAALPHGPWTLDPHPDAARPVTAIKRADGAGIHFDADRHTGKASVTGLWPRSDDPRCSDYFGPSGYSGDPRIEISVSALRDPSAAAKDIAKRFLPDYLARYAVALQRKREWAEHNDRAEADIARLVEAAGTEPHSHNRRPGYARISIPGGTVERRGGTDIKIEASSVPLDAAVAIIKILRDARSKEKP